MNDDYPPDALADRIRAMNERQLQSALFYLRGYLGNDEALSKAVRHAEEGLPVTLDTQGKGKGKIMSYPTHDDAYIRTIWVRRHTRNPPRFDLRVSEVGEPTNLVVDETNLTPHQFRDRMSLAPEIPAPYVERLMVYAESEWLVV